MDFFLYPEKLFFDSFNTSSMDRFFSHEKDYPPYDLYRDEDGSYVLELAVAGYPEDCLSVSVEKNLLVVSSNKVEEDKKDKKGFYRRSRRAFKKAFRDPYGTLNFSAVEATLQNGILSVRVPLKEEVKPHEIKILSK